MAESAEAHTPVRLEVVNAEAGTELRCVLVLAHFVTLEAGRIAPGESLSLSLSRDGRDGTLAMPRDDGRWMAVESLLCGAAERWSDSYAGVPLTGLADGTRARLRVACALDGRVTCQPDAE